MAIFNPSGGDARGAWLRAGTALLVGLPVIVFLVSGVTYSPGRPQDGEAAAGNPIALVVYASLIFWPLWLAALPPGVRFSSRAAAFGLGVRRGAGGFLLFQLAAFLPVLTVAHLLFGGPLVLLEALGLAVFAANLVVFVILLRQGARRTRERLARVAVPVLTAPPPPDREA